MTNIRPYITINGHSSNELTGLMICSLPPITKPPKRVTIEEIDGKDGDSVTELGFSAYDKPVEIGLYGNYNINAIINFLNQSGRITFSNEADKYYLFAQYAGVDFEKLIRLKSANVSFHVQPFKYSLTETEIVATFSSSATSGQMTIHNSGNYFSRPLLKITGSGTVVLNLNSSEILELDMSEDGVIIIDSAGMNALAPDGTLLNRKVTGNYDRIRLTSGDNILSYSGTVTEITVNNYSRWL